VDISGRGNSTTKVIVTLEKLPLEFLPYLNVFSVRNSFPFSQSSSLIVTLYDFNTFLLFAHSVLFLLLFTLTSLIPYAPLFAQYQRCPSLSGGMSGSMAAAAGMSRSSQRSHQRFQV